MSHTVRVFVNGLVYDAPASGTALDAVARHGAEAAAAVADGSLVITDGRGLPVAPDAAVSNGAVLRLVPNRGRDAVDPAAQLDT